MEPELPDPMFNEEQLAYMGYLNSLPREQKCDCGWAARGDCYGMCYGDPDKGGAVPKAQRGSVPQKDEAAP